MKHIMGCNALYHGIWYYALCAVFFKAFTMALFFGIVFWLFYQLGTSCFWGCCFLNPIVTGVPGGFSIIIFYLMQDRGINSQLLT
jgi:hypothetical protein